MFVVSPVHAQTPTFSIDPATISADPGDQFTVDVKVSNFMNLISFQYSMKWNADVLRLDGTENYTSDLAGFNENAINTNDPGKLVASWFDQSISPNTLSDGSTVYTMRFTALSGGNTTIEFTEEFATYEVLTDQEEDVGLNPINATATVSGDGGGGGGGGANTDPVQITAGTASGENGDEVCVPFQVTDFTDITNFQFSINYDASVLQYSSVRAFGIPSLSSSQFSSPSAGNLVIDYSNTNGVSVANNTTAFEVCYNLVGTAPVSSNISVSGSPTVIDVQRSNMNVALNSTAGQITIVQGNGGGGTGGGMGNGDNPLSIILGTASGQVGDNVCIPISVVDFVNIVSFQHSISYNQSVMTFTGAQNLNLAGLEGGIGSSSPGTISVSWLDQTTNGVSLDNNTTIAEICFDLISNGSSSLNITGNPTPIEVTDVEGNGQNIGLTPTSGQITSGDGGGNGGGGNGGGNGTADCATATGFTCVASDVDTEPGNNFCVDVVTNDFDDIISMQFSMNWNPSIVQFTGIQNLGLPALAETNFNTQDVNQGLLNVSWIDESTEGISLADCEDILFSVCFTAIGNEGDFTNFEFSSNPTPIEIINANEQEVPFNGDLGIINLVGEAIPNIIFSAGDITADEGAAFCIPVSVEGFDNISTFQYDMQFDQSILQFNRVEVVNNVLPNFSNGQFDASNAANGTVSVGWFNSSGVNVPDNTTIYNICFDAIGSGTTNMSFANAQVGNGAGQSVPFVGNRSNIIINTSEPITPVQVGDTFFPNTGDQRCAVVSASNFDDIISMQYGMTWDASLFRYESVNILSGGNTIGLNLSAFGNPEPNRLTISWIEGNLENVSLPQDEPIYEVCFTALGPIGTQDPFIFVNNPSFEVTDEDGNELPFNGGNGTLIIGEDTGGVSFTADVQDESAPGANDGSITLSVTGCNGTPTYTWSAPLQAETGSSVQNLAAGNYTVTVRCGEFSETRTFTVNAASSIVINTEVTNASCVNFTDGSILLTVSGGTPNYTFNWSDIGESTEDRFGLTAGTYIVTITDANGAQFTSDPIVVGGNTTALNLQVNSVTNANCSNQATGGVNIDINGGSMPYNVAWNDNPNIDDEDRNDLLPGNYVITITDANGCIEDESFNIGADNNGVDISNIQTTPVSDAGGDGSISVDVTGGNGNGFNYAWTGPDNFMDDTEDISGLNVAGTYTLVVTDNDSGCMATIDQNLNSPLGVTADIMAACFGQSTGGIDITPFGGGGGYQFMWTGSNFEEPTEDIADVSPGTYNLKITDADGAMINRSYIIEQGAQINVTTTVTNEMGAPGSNNGSITVDATGGAGEFTFAYSNGITSTTNMANNLTAGSYAVTVTDGIGCTQVVNNIIVENEATALAVDVVPTAASCNDVPNGAFTVNITGGAFPYRIQIGEAVDSTINETTATFNNIPSGTFVIMVTDGNNTSVTATETITQPDPITSDNDNTAIFDLTNSANCNGGINLELTGGNMPYMSFDWTGPNGFAASTEDLGGICAGDYIVTVKDANGCTQTLDPITVQVFAVDVNASVINRPACPDTETGVIQLAVNGGAEPLTYVWTDTSGDTVSNDKDLDSVPAGEYTVSITDNNQRSITETFTIEPTSDLSVTTNILTNYNGFDASCADAMDATVQAVATSSVGNVTYSWSTNETTQAIAVGAGTYSIVVSDADGCTNTQEVTVTAPPAIEVTFSTSPVTCAGESDGEITAMASGGVGTYTYLWDDNTTNPTNFGLEGGSYSVSVTDQNGCSALATQELAVVEELTVTAEVVNITVSTAGSATVNVTGGTAPYSYMWNTAETTPTITTSKEGEYTVVVEDANGCSTDITVEILFEVDCFTGRPIITPDGDGLNDEFIINCITTVDDNSLQIFNRWGQLVFEQENYDNTWMGTNVRGDALPEGGYFWVLEYRDASGAQQQVKGSMTIIIE